MPIHTLIQKYMEFCREQKKLSPATIKGYAIDLKQFYEAVSKEDEPFGKECLNYYCRLLNKRYKPRTVKRKLASVRAFCRWLEFEEILSTDPFKKVNVKIQQVKQIPVYLPLASMEKILEIAYEKRERANRRKHTYKVCVQNVAILELLFATGLRVSELCSLRRENLQMFPGSVRVLGKGNKERIVPIENKEVISAIQMQIKVCSEKIDTNGYLFYNQRGKPISQQSVRNMVIKYAKEAGIPGRITPHIIRHTFATLMLEQDVDIRYIQNLLGHSSIRTTEIYTTVTRTKERQIIASKHPRNYLSFLQVNTTLSGKSQEKI